jgi:hypothetical protein
VGLLGFIHYLIQLHSRALKNLHCLTAQKPMLHPIHFGKGTLPQEAFHFVGVSHDLILG